MCLFAVKFVRAHLAFNRQSLVIRSYCMHDYTWWRLGWARWECFSLCIMYIFVCVCVLKIKGASSNMRAEQSTPLSGIDDHVLLFRFISVTEGTSIHQHFIKYNQINDDSIFNCFGDLDFMKELNRCSLCKICEAQVVYGNILLFLTVL